MIRTAMFLLIFSFLPLSAEAAGPMLASHRALYAVRMTGPDSSGELNGMNGRIYYEQARQCESWLSTHRYATRYDYADGKPATVRGYYTATEAADGSDFSFYSEQENAAGNLEELKGTVVPRADGGARAVYAIPDGVLHDLERGYFLPLAHTAEILRRARAGETFFDATVFDGTSADGPATVGTFIGKKIAVPPPPRAKKKSIDARLLTPDAWDVRTAYFTTPAADDDNLEAVPAYEVRMTLHDNGVVSHAVIDYPTFRVEQTLLVLESVPPVLCR